MLQRTILFVICENKDIKQSVVKLIIVKYTLTKDTSGMHDRL
jgi:hypothetical protein